MAITRGVQEEETHEEPDSVGSPLQYDHDHRTTGHGEESSGLASIESGDGWDSSYSAERVRRSSDESFTAKTKRASAIPSNRVMPVNVQQPELYSPHAPLTPQTPTTPTMQLTAESFIALDNLMNHVHEEGVTVDAAGPSASQAVRSTEGGEEGAGNGAQASTLKSQTRRSSFPSDATTLPTQGWVAEAGAFAKIPDAEKAAAEAAELPETRPRKSFSTRLSQRVERVIHGRQWQDPESSGAVSTGASLSNLQDFEEELGIDIGDGVPNKKGLLNPRSKVIKYWDLIMFNLLTFTAVVTPYEVSFLSPKLGVLFVFNRVVDLGFVTDMVVTFFLPTQNVDGSWVDNQPQIINQYIRGTLWIDVISVLPYDLLVITMGDSSTGNLGEVLRMLRLMRLAKLLRVVRANRILVRMESQLAINYAKLRLFKFVIIVLVVSHWLACAWNMLKVLEESRFQYSDFEDGGSGYLNWINYYIFIDEDSTTSTAVYIASLYWAVATLSTLGYGDILPTTDLERVFVTGAALIGASIYAYMVGAVCSIVAGMNERNTKFYQQVDNLNQFMAEKAMPQALQEQLRDYFRFKRFNSDGGTSHHLLSSMSPKLRGEVSKRLHGKWLTKLPIFADSPPEFYTELSMILKTQVFGMRELIIKEGEINHCMHIVERGLVVSRGKFVTRGKPIGEDMLQASRKRWYHAITLVNTVVYTLGRDRLFNILDNFPEMKARLRWRVVRKVFREAILSYTQMVRSNLNVGTVINTGRSMSEEGARDLQQLNTNIAPLIASHRISMLRQDHQEEYQEMERAVVSLQRLFRMKQAKLTVARIKSIHSSRTQSQNQMVQLLNRLQYPHYIAAFLREKIDLELLRKLSLIELRVATEVPLGDCIQILQAAAHLRMPAAEELYKITSVPSMRAREQSGLASAAAVATIATSDGSDSSDSSRRRQACDSTEAAVTESGADAGVGTTLPDPAWAVLRSEEASERSAELLLSEASNASTSTSPLPGVVESQEEPGARENIV